VNLNKYKYKPVLITQSVEELITRTMDSNFVPITDDRGMFIGIVTRRSIIKHYYEKNILPQE
jgi:CBS-domain-containing membrane protein